MLNVGIYAIKNLLDGKIYIGQSRCIDKRKSNHFIDLKRNAHKNIHLQNAYNKYGKENFVFQVLLYCDPENLTYYEQTLVEKLKPHYNIKKECQDGTFHADETKEKISKKLMGNKNGAGIIFSDEWKRDMSARMSGSCNPMWGKHRQKK